MEMNIIDLLWHGGFVVKLVLFLLVLGSIFSWAIIINRYKNYKKINQFDFEFLNIFNQSKNLTEIYQKTQKLDDSLLSHIFKSVFLEIQNYEQIITHFNKSDRQKAFKEHGFGNIERSIRAAINTNQQRLDEQLSTLASIGSITPFIGLLGTVWGIIDAFSSLGSGGGSIEVVAPGIAEALVATAIGLFAAIPAVWFFNKFNYINGTHLTKMENFSSDLLNLLERSNMSEQVV